MPNKRNATFKVTTRSRETEGVYFDFENPSSVKAALTGVTKVFLIRPPHLADAKVFPACCRCRKRNRYKTHCIFILLGVEKIR